jgi:hypothetical protein
VYLRLEPRWDSIEVRAAAVALARELERRHPTEITANWWKEERGTRVFVDFNQNAPHKTVFGAWFARPRVGGQVSTPLTWDEVETVVPDTLTIRSVPDLVAERGDPWADIAASPQSIEPLLALAARDKEAGLHDAPWPPQYPKMPDEPPRVAPSRAKKTDETPPDGDGAKKKPAPAKSGKSAASRASGKSATPRASGKSATPTASAPADQG